MVTSVSWPPLGKPMLLDDVAATEPMAETPVSTAARVTVTVRGGGVGALPHPASTSAVATSAVAPTALRGEKIMPGPTTFKQLSDVCVMHRARYVTPSCEWGSVRRRRRAPMASSW